MSTDVTADTDSAATRAATAKADIGELSKRLLEESFNDGRLELVYELGHPEGINHDPAEPARMRGMRGPELLKQTVEMYRAAFPDVRITVDEVIVADDKVVMRWHSEGTHTGELEGLAPTGAKVSVTGISIDLWKDGKVVETWTQWDNLGLARQLGAAPPEGSIGEKIGLQLQHLTARRMRKKNQM